MKNYRYHYETCGRRVAAGALNKIGFFFAGMAAGVLCGYMLLCLLAV